MLQVDGQRIASAEDLEAVLRRHKPGDQVTVRFRDRSEVRTANLRLAEDPHLEIVPIESAGGTLVANERAFRDGWLGPKRL